VTVPEDWFLTSEERGNPSTRIDLRRPDGRAWVAGNDVRPLVHGRAYFAELLAAVRRLRRGDLLLFTDWRGDPDERLDGALDSAGGPSRGPQAESSATDTGISRVFCEAAERGVVVKGLIWRSHLDRFSFSERENRHLGEEIEDAGGECLRDMRVRIGGSHHQKFMVLRHVGKPEWDVAYVGGIDLCHSRNDDAAHHGDPQTCPMSPEYGDRPPWHDVQVAIRGPAVGEVEAVFRERWNDPAPLSRNPLHRLRDALQHEDTKPSRLPEQLPDPPPAGTCAVQLLRTYPHRRKGYPFAPQGERSIARGYVKAVARARQLIYVEDQYLWSPQVADVFASALRAEPELHLIVVVPQFPDQPGNVARAPQLLGRQRALDILRAAGGPRVAVYSPYNVAGTPVYVHAKVCVIDDTWATVGSDNFNLRSWTYDSELSCAVVDTAVPAEYARQLRLTLAAEHLGRSKSDMDALIEPRLAFAALADSAAALDEWYANGCQGPRPAGQLRAYQPPRLSRWSKRWAAPLYRWLYDPDGRPPALRRQPGFAL
jgi:phosphatidylserine/phosphatidylglycerophosphate/cardiolipin synthase-like enzyme